MEIPESARKSERAGRDEKVLQMRMKVLTVRRRFYIFIHHLFGVDYKVEEELMFEIDHWSKDHLHKVTRELLFSFNYMWFLMEGWIKEHCPEKAESDEFLKLSEDFGAYEAGRLQRVVEEDAGGVDRLVEFLKRSHWCAFEDIEMTKISDRELIMRTIGCTAQKAVKKWGMEYYACGRGGLVLREGFFRKLTPRARVTRIFTPPDSRPEGTPDKVSCEWRICI